MTEATPPKQPQITDDVWEYHYLYRQMPRDGSLAPLPDVVAPKLASSFTVTDELPVNQAEPVPAVEP